MSIYAILSDDTVDETEEQVSPIVEEPPPKKQRRFHKNRPKTKLCRYYKKHGRCNNGVKCDYAHHFDELVIVEDERYKTILCKDFEDGECEYREKCLYAHGTDELREKPVKKPTGNRYKTILCKYYAAEEECPYAEKCMYAHGADELRSRSKGVNIEQPTPQIPGSLPPLNINNLNDWDVSDILIEEEDTDCGWVSSKF